MEDNQEVGSQDPTNHDNKASQESSANTSDSSSTEVVTMATIPADTAFSLATIESETGLGDNMASKVIDELQPTHRTCTAAFVDVEPLQTTMCEEKQVGVQTEMRASTTDSYPMEYTTIKTNNQKIEDVVPMEQ
jgi:hypothetical protein